MTSRADIPPSIELAWGLRDRGTRGPKRGLTLERIVAAGIEVAARDGLEAVSMAGVAEELGAGTMSLYRYVDSKDELLTLMVDTALGPPRADSVRRRAAAAQCSPWATRGSRMPYIRSAMKFITTRTRAMTRKAPCASG